MGGEGRAAPCRRGGRRGAPRAARRGRPGPEGSPGLIHWSLQAWSGLPARARADASLTVAERARLAGLHVAKRRADWLAGRVAAKSVVAAALAQARPGDWPLHVLEIPSDPSGRPWARLAPEAGARAGFAPGERLPISVSISHAEGHALCAATWAEPGDRSRWTIGIDLAFLEPRSRAFEATFFTEEEQRFVRDAPPRDRALRANLIWCAKEAVLKALGLGLTVDTWALSCVPGPGRADPAGWPIAPADDAWRPFVAACGPPLLPGGGTVRGIWRPFRGFVGALAAHAAPGEPARRASTTRG